MKAAIAILVCVCLALGGVLLLSRNKAQQQLKEDSNQISVLSNQWVETRSKLTEQEKVNVSLETNLDTRVQEISTFSNRLIEVSGTLAKVELEAKEAKAATKAAQEEVAKRDAKIGELESERDELTKKMIGLNTSITNLEGQIKDTERKLAASEGDREFLLKELKRLQAEKAELERQFNDLAVLREQVKKLKEELSITRRLEWIRRGLYGEQKGGQKLQAGFPAPAPKTNYDLNVEIRRDGGAKVIPPATNAPAAVNPPAPK